MSTNSQSPGTRTKAGKSRALRWALSAITAGITAGGGVILGAHMETGGIGQTTWVVAGITLLVSAAKDLQSRLKETQQ